VITKETFTNTILPTLVLFQSGDLASQKFAEKCELQKKLKHLTNLRRGGNAVDEEKRFNWIRKKKEEVANAAAEHAKAALELVLTTAEAAMARDDASRVFEELRKEILVKPSSNTQTMQYTTANTNSDDFSSVEGSSTQTSQESAEIFCSINQISQESSETIDGLHFCGTFLRCLDMGDGENSLTTFETIENTATTTTQSFL